MNAKNILLRVCITSVYKKALFFIKINGVSLVEYTIQHIYTVDYSISVQTVSLLLWVQKRDIWLEKLSHLLVNAYHMNAELVFRLSNALKYWHKKL